MKQYTEIEHLTIHNEGNALIQRYMSSHISSYDLDQCLQEDLLDKLNMLHNILQLEIYHNIAIGSVCNYSMAHVIFQTRQSIARSFKDNLLNPKFLI